MTNENEITISIDFKKERIRFHKNVLKAMHYPDFFRILVNPELPGMVIEACAASDAGAYSVQKMCHRDKELNSKSLIQNIAQCMNQRELVTVKLTGSCINHSNGIFFRMDQAAISGDHPVQTLG